jgi:hypothetical protein
MEADQCHEQQLASRRSRRASGPNVSLKAGEPGEPMFWFQSEGRKKLIFQFQVSQAERILFYSQGV